jgi:hypothetical protein
MGLVTVRSPSLALADPGGDEYQTKRTAVPASTSLTSATATNSFADGS